MNAQQKHLQGLLFWCMLLVCVVAGAAVGCALRFDLLFEGGRAVILLSKTG